MVDKKVESGAPFIIWTFRRTGGTNLGQALFDASPFEQVEHEPFNYDRVFGDVTRRFKETGDVERLRYDVELILEKRPLIKHCLEIIPQELNLILAELSIKFGYKSIFLYREYAKDRLLSLNYAQTTGVWGKEQKKKLEDNPNIFKTPFPVSKMIQHENICRQKMTGVFNFLLSYGVDPIIVSFESLYQHKVYEYSCLLVSDIFRKLELSDEIATDAFLEKILKRGNQGTKSDYLKFPGAENFVKESDKLTRYSLHREMISDIKVHPKNLALNYVELWPALNGLCLDEFYISGVLLPEGHVHSVQFFISDSLLEGKTNLPSPRIKDMFPNEEGAEKCRFLVGPILYASAVDITVVAG